MKQSRPRRKSLTAEEAIRRMESDPEYIAGREEQERLQEERMQQFALAAAPMMEELRKAGYDVRDSPYDLIDLFRRTRIPYTSAVPILVKWLPRVSRSDVKEGIVRALSVPWAKEAALPLLQEFRESPAATGGSGVKWAIGNALEVIADDTMFSDISSLVRDKRHGRDREMLVLALAKMKDTRTIC
jgi:hypothetical protein